MVVLGGGEVEEGGGGRMQVIKTCVNVAVNNVPVQLLLGMQL